MVRRTKRDEIADACGFTVGVVARLLRAMEQGDAARRIPADAEAGIPQRWQPGSGKTSEADPNPAPLPDLPPGDPQPYAENGRP